MAGFVGVYQFQPDAVGPEAFAGMGVVLTYHGPLIGQYADETVLLRHQRSPEARDGAEAQPIEREHVVVVAHARIDGQAELRARLRQAGMTPTDADSDGALILLAYLAFGDTFVDTLIGDFSFALWDKNARKLILARDPIGKRSLYFAQTKGALAFSTDLRALRRLPDVDDRIDPTYIGDFLLLGEGFWIDRTQTPFRGIRRLDRASTLTVHEAQIATRRYWAVPEPDQTPLAGDEHSIIEAFRSVFEQAVADRLRGDRVVLTLSGGMDSSTVTATAVALSRRTGSDARLTAVTSAYTRFADPEQIYGQQIAAFLNIEQAHRLYSIDRFRMIYPYVHVANAIRQSLVPSQWVDFQRFLASHGQVVLYGYLGDLLLSDSPVAAGLRHMKPWTFARAYRQLWAYFGRRPALGSGLLSRGKRTADVIPSYPMPPWLNADFARRQGLLDRWNAYWAGLSQLGAHHRSPHLVRMLTNYDYYGHDETDAIDFPLAESADPFADVRVIEFLFRLPPLPWFHQKYLLRRLMADRLPANILMRPKQIFGDVAAHMLGQPENAWIDQWQPSAQVEEFVVRSMVPPITGRHALMNVNTGVHIRPLLLDRWLRREFGRGIQRDE